MRAWWSVWCVCVCVREPIFFRWVRPSSAKNQVIINHLINPRAVEYLKKKLIINHLINLFALPLLEEGWCVIHRGSV